MKLFMPYKSSLKELSDFLKSDNPAAVGRFFKGRATENW